MGSSRITDQLLEELTETWYDAYDYLGTGTSSDTVSDTDTNLTSPVQIGTTASDFHKIAESGTTESFLAGQSWTRLFILNTVEPNSLPVNLREFGNFKTGPNNSDMASRFVTNVSHTKDNTISFRVRFTGRVSRIN